MGVSEKGGSDYGGGVNFGRCLRSFVRRKQVDSENTNQATSNHQLAKALSIPHLIAIGVGSTIGAGVYILVGTVARELSGPALTFSFLIAGIAAGLSAFCYAELASRCPSAGSAYHYSYICVGESVAWVIGWGLILEYTISGSAVARGISPNLASLFGGQDSLPFFLARQHIPVLDIVVDPCAAEDRRLRGVDMEWLEKMMFPLQGRLPGFASRFRFRKTGLLNLHQDVEACEYQDVHIMWEMLNKTETELGSRPKTNRPIWNMFRWTRISPCLGTPIPIAMSQNTPA